MILQFRVFHILSILILVSIETTQNQYSTKINETENHNIYTVEEIDEEDSYHVVYLTRENRNYKAISKKESNSNPCNAIEICKKYRLVLNSFLDRKITIDDKQVSIGMSCLIKCIGLDKKTMICTDEENGFYDIYEIENLKGLCILTN